MSEPSAERQQAWPHDQHFHAWWVEPGLVLAGEYPGSIDASTAKLELLADAGIRTIVDLTTPEDRLTPYRDDWMALGAAVGVSMRHERHPIPDVGIIDLDGYRRIVELIRHEVAASRPVYVHCWGGIGRTGTVVGCLLAGRDRTTDDILAKIADLRAGTRKAHRRAPETLEQVGVITAWLGGLGSTSLPHTKPNRSAIALGETTTNSMTARLSPM